MATLLAVFYFPPKVDAKGRSYVQRLGGIDFVGCVLFAGGILLILVGLTLGGAVYAWDSAPTVATIVVGFGMLIALAVHQIFIKRDGIFRRELFQNRNLALCLFGIFTVRRRCRDRSDVEQEGFAYIMSVAAMRRMRLRSQLQLVLRRSSQHAVGSEHVWPRMALDRVCLGGRGRQLLLHRHRLPLPCDQGAHDLGRASRASRSVQADRQFAIFLIAAICFATADQNSSKSSIGFAVLAAIGISSPLSFIFAAARASRPPQPMLTMRRALDRPCLCRPGHGSARRAPSGGR